MYFLVSTDRVHPAGKDLQGRPNISKSWHVEASCFEKVLNKVSLNKVYFCQCINLLLVHVLFLDFE